MEIKSEVNVLLGCTGSVASVKVPLLAEGLKAMKFTDFPDLKVNVQVVASEHALFFFDHKSMSEKFTVHRDKDEWSTWSKISDPILHIELRRWADIMIIAPLDANTLAKIANGLCDNLLTCVVRAWDVKKPLMFCPAMNTHMWNHPLTFPQVQKLKELGYTEVPCICKKLACGDTGYGAMAEVATIISEAFRKLQLCLKGCTPSTSSQS